jgi:hypothetical protein
MAQACTASGEKIQWLFVQNVVAQPVKAQSDKLKDLFTDLDCLLDKFFRYCG